MNAIARLAQQQQRLLGTVLAGTDDIQWILPAGQASGALARRGLQAYQSHGLALAERALSAAYPVIQQLIGADNFGPLARYFWRQQPPDAGDMARWGYGLADFLQTAASLADEPFLCDVARVEWALHRAASAADAQLDAPSFALLAAEPPAAPTLSLSPGVWLLVSAYPVVSLIEAHKLPHATGAGAGACGRTIATWNWRASIGLAAGLQASCSPNQRGGTLPARIAARRTVDRNGADALGGASGQRECRP